MFGINRYRCFEAAWLDLEGCPQGAIIDFEASADIQVDTFALKQRLDSLHSQRFADLPAYLNAALQLFPHLQALPSTPLDTHPRAELQLPLRVICPISAQPHLAFVCFEITPDLRLPAFIRGLDGQSLSIEAAADLIFAFCRDSGNLTGLLGVSSARRGGIATISIRSAQHTPLWEQSFPFTGIE
jgi:hypothetical protein